MAIFNIESFRIFERLIAETGNTYSFDAESSVAGMITLFEVIKDMGLNPMETEDIKQGLLSLFNVEFINMPDLSKTRYIFTPNHVSDFDAILLGLLHPKILIVSKSDWTNNVGLKGFLDLHYNLYGFDRASLKGLRDLLKYSIDYFATGNDNKHYLIFSQGTISDLNKNSLERISPIAQRISDRTDVSIVNIYLEQVSLYHPTRIVFDNPVMLSQKQDFRSFWLERETEMQKSLDPPVRLPVLSHKHSNNNRPGDPFF